MVAYLFAEDEIFQVLFDGTRSSLFQQLHRARGLEFDSAVVVRKDLYTQLGVAVCQPCTVLLDQGLVSNARKVFAQLVLAVYKSTTHIFLAFEDSPPRSQHF